MLIENTCLNSQRTEIGCRGSQNKIGILVAQLGTPDAPTPKALRKYLAQFLADPRVIEAPRLLWWFILNFIILPFRPKRSARLYSRIWTKDGSPLMLTTIAQTKGLKAQIQNQYPKICIEYGMRYGSPSLESALDKLIADGCSKILLFPMYPQYSATTSAATYDVVFTHLLKRRWVPTLRVAEPYYLHPQFLKAQAERINQFLKNSDKPPEKLVFSYHGIPEAYVEKGDPYCCMCTETTAALIPLLDFPKDDIIHTFQSRFGKDPWLVPYTDETIEELGKKGVKHIALACPGFTADCLETLDELGNEGKEQFAEHGGERLDLIPCLNEFPEWISAMKQITLDEISSWLPNPALEGQKCLAINCPVKAAKATARSHEK